LKRALKWLGIAVGVVVVLAIVAAIALPRLIDTPRVQALIASSAAQAVGRPVKWESLSVGLFPRIPRPRRGQADPAAARRAGRRPRSSRE